MDRQQESGVAYAGASMVQPRSSRFSCSAYNRRRQPTCSSCDGPAPDSSRNRRASRAYLNSLICNTDYNTKDRVAHYVVEVEAARLTVWSCSHFIACSPLTPVVGLRSRRRLPGLSDGEAPVFFDREYGFGCACKVGRHGGYRWRNTLELGGLRAASRCRPSTDAVIGGSRRDASYRRDESVTSVQRVLLFPR